MKYRYFHPDGSEIPACDAATYVNAIKVPEPLLRQAEAIRHRINGFIDPKFPNGKRRPKELRRHLWAKALEATDYAGFMNEILFGYGLQDRLIGLPLIPQTFEEFLAKYP